MPATQPESINGTLLRRILTLTAIKLCRRWRPGHSGVLFLSRRICVKYGYFTNISEALTMQFIAQKTSIPVPKVYCAFKHKDCTYIVMERIDGTMIGQGWALRSKESQDRLLGQLKGMISQMRKTPAPEGIGVADIRGKSIFDQRLPKTSKDSLRFGPFASVSEFHLYLRQGIEDCPAMPEVSKLVEMHRGAWPVCFTHGDLSSLNILAKGDDIVGIVDWETAGWYPSYWEYTSTCYVNPWNEFWREEVDKFLEPLPAELAMDELRLKYFGEFPCP